MAQFTLTQVAQWLNANVGANHITYDYNGRSLGAQCKGLTNAYAQFLGIPKVQAYYARDMFKNADTRYYERLNNTISFVPRLGDIAVMDNHTSIVQSGNLLKFTSLDQNWVNSNNMGSSAQWVTHNYLRPKVIGFLRPKNIIVGAQATPAQPQPAPAPANTPAGTYYQIKRGDTFWGLENAWRIPHGSLQSLNPGLDPRKLQIGQRIRRS